MTEAPPRISIILPTYNRAAYLGEAVASVLAQQGCDFELLVVDDGSTDNTRALLEVIDDSRLHCIFQPNAGRSRARNVALEAARGELVGFLDSDDMFLPGKLACQMAFLDSHPDHAMVYTAAAFIDSDGERTGNAYAAPVAGRIYPYIAFFRPVTILLPTVLLRRSALDAVGGFDEAMERFEDTDLWRRVAKRHLVGAIDKETCLIRTHCGNVLARQNPAKIKAALDHYVTKLRHEDAHEVSPAVLSAGIRRLYGHYAAALLSVAEFAPIGQILAEQARDAFQPKVSIVVPVYNGADYLAEAIDSALAQDYPNLEVVVVNDGSTDGGASERIAQRYGERIHYVAQPNGGVASALNRGIETMSGDYFSWLSHDDLYVPNKLARQVEQLAQEPSPENTVLYGDYTVFVGSPELGTATLLPATAPEDFRYFITTNNVLHGCTLLVPRGAFIRHGGFNPALRTTQDYDLWFRMAATERFVHHPGILVQARAHAEQGTHKLKDLVLVECNTLLAGFVEHLSPEEVARGSGLAGLAGYFLVAADLARRGFEQAATRTAELGREKALQAAGQAVDVRALVEPLADALQLRVREVDRLTRERDELYSERDRLAQALAAIERSSFWRLSGPLRRLAMLLLRR